MMSHPKSETGVSLLEVLVTIVIMAVGLLGLAKLQVSTLRNNQNSLYRSEATFLANDILDSMRVYNNLAPHSRAEEYNTASPGPGAVAKADVAAWQGRIAQALPDGVGTIVFDPAGRIATIRIEWNDRRTAGPDCDKAARSACFETQGGV